MCPSKTYTTFSLRNWDIANYVHAAYQVVRRKNTNIDVLKFLLHFYKSLKKEKNLWNPYKHEVLTGRVISLLKTGSTSLVVWWSELLTTKHEIPGSIPGSTMGIFPCRGRIPVVTIVWVVSRFRLKVETSVTRSHNSINSDWIHDRDLLAGGDLTKRDS